MIKNTTRARLKAGEAVYGFRLDFASTSLVESLGGTGYDFIYFDLEHGPLSEESVLEMVRVAEMTGLTPLVRVASGSPGMTQRLLDSGVMGIIFPHCNTGQEVMMAVEAVKFPPEGQRGIAGRSLNLSRMSVADYVVEANRETMVIAMIEEKEALDNLTEIIAVPGLDVLFIGRLDLSLSLGIPGKINDRLMEDAVDEVISRGQAAGRAVGVGAIGAAGAEEARRFRQKGARFFALNAASILASRAVSLLKELKAD